MFIERRSQKWPFCDRKTSGFQNFLGRCPRPRWGAYSVPQTPAGHKPCYARPSRFARPFIFLFSIWRPLLTEILDPPVVCVCVCVLGGGLLLRKTKEKKKKRNKEKCLLYCPVESFLAWQFCCLFVGCVSLFGSFRRCCSFLKVS